MSVEGMPACLPTRLPTACWSPRAARCAEVNMPDVGSWLVDSKGRFQHEMPPTVFYQMEVSGLWDCRLGSS